MNSMVSSYRGAGNDNVTVSYEQRNTSDVSGTCHRGTAMNIVTWYILQRHSNQHHCYIVATVNVITTS